jgi:hypothetical protein
MPAMVAAAILTFAYVIMSTLTLTPSQQAVKNFGQYGAYAGFGVAAIQPGDNITPTDLADVLEAAGSEASLATFVSVDISLARDPDTYVTYREGEWDSDALRGRLALTGGRWPQEPGEVVVSKLAAFRAQLGQAVPLLAGRAKVRVVGTYDDRFFETAEMLAASGTWARFDASLRRDFPALTATPVVFWTASNDSAVLDALADKLTPWVAAASGQEVRHSLQASYRTRASAASEEPDSQLDRWPMAYTIPALALPILATGTALGLNDRRLRQALRRLGEAGVPGPVSLAALLTSLMIWVGAGVVVGVASGWLIGLGFHQLLPLVVDQPPAPPPWPTLPAAQILGLTALTVTSAAMWLRPRREAPNRVHDEGQRGRRDERGRNTRHILAAAAGCVSLWQVSRMESAADAMWLAAALLILILTLVPDLISIIVVRLPERGARSRLTLRQLRRDPARVSATVMSLTIALSLAIGFVALLDTMVRTARLQDSPPALAGQVVVADPASDLLRPSREPIRMAQAALTDTGASRIPLRFLGDFSAVLETEVGVSLPGQLRYIVAVDSLVDAGRFMGRPLKPAELEALSGGGMMIWTDSDFAQSASPRAVRLEVAPRDGRSKSTAPLPVTYSDVDLSDTRLSTDGLLLSGTARGLRLPLTAGAVMFAPVSQDEAKSVQAALRSAGMNPDTLRVYRAPEPPIPPLILRLTAVTLLLLLFGTFVSSSRSQVRALRAYIQGLRAVGISRKWVGQVLAAQYLVMMAISSFLALLVAIPPVLAAAWLLPHYRLSLPVGQMGTVLLATMLAGLAATATSLRSLMSTTDDS